jgi:hypothetical protein
MSCNWSLAVGIIFIAKANDLAIIVNDSIFGHDGPFCITPDVVLNAENGDREDKLRCVLMIALMEPPMSGVMEPL